MSKSLAPDRPTCCDDHDIDGTCLWDLDHLDALPHPLALYVRRNPRGEVVVGIDPERGDLYVDPIELTVSQVRALIPVLSRGLALGERAAAAV